MAYLLKDNPSGISAREQVMFILVKDSESSIPSKGLKNLRFRAKLSDNSCEFRLREQLFCGNKLINPVLFVRKLQYDVLSFENRY